MTVCRLAAVAVAAALVAAMSVRAQPPDGTYVYTIEHSAHGELGTATHRIARRGDETIVETELSIAAKALFVVVHRHEESRREVWRDGQLISFEGTTNDNGTMIELHGRRDGDRFVIDGPDGPAEAPPTIRTSNPWSIDITKAMLVMGTTSGELRKVRIETAEETILDLGGRRIPTRYFRMTGDMTRELWYDADDVLVRLTWPRGGDLITFTLR